MSALDEHRELLSHALRLPFDEWLAVLRAGDAAFAASIASNTEAGTICEAGFAAKNAAMRAAINEFTKETSNE